MSVSIIWKFFTKCEDDLQKAECNICGKKYSRKDGSTGNMRKHLQSAHEEACEELMDDEKAIAEESARKTAKATPRVQAEVALKQQTLQQALTGNNPMWADDDPKSLAIDFRIAEMFALDDAAFLTPQHLGFQRVLQTAQPKYRIKGRTYYKERAFEQVHAAVHKKVASLVADLQWVSFTSDAWSDIKSGTSLLSLTGHGIREDGSKCQVVLHAQSLEDRHTAENIRQETENMLDGWGLRDKVHALVRDNAANMVAAYNLMDVDHIGCANHIVQLVVNDALKPEVQRAVSDMISRCKRIATHFDHSNQACAELTALQRQLGEPVKKIVQAVATRWNSTFYMLECLYQSRRSISAYIASAKTIGFPAPAAHEWELMKHLVIILRPFEEMTRQLSDHNTSVADVIPTVCAVQKLLTDRLNAQQQHGVGTVLESLVSGVERRFKNIENNSVYGRATFLDPRYKTKFLSTAAADKIKIDIAAELGSVDAVVRPSPSKRPRLQADSEEAEEEEIPTTSAAAASLATSIDAMMASSSETEEEDTTSAAKFKEIVEKYAKTKRISKEEEPGKYWASQIDNDFTRLRPIAFRYLSCPATSVPSEQLFSSAGLIYQPNRNRTDGATAEKLLFLKYNLPLVKFDYEI